MLRRTRRSWLLNMRVCTPKIARFHIIASGSTSRVMMPAIQ
jgi:hypothetical protein